MTNRIASRRRVIVLVLGFFAARPKLVAAKQLPTADIAYCLLVGDPIQEHPQHGVDEVVVTFVCALDGTEEDVKA